MIQFLQKIAGYIHRYQWVITITLFICVAMQSSTIAQLRSELKFVKDKYEVIVPQQDTSIQITDTVSKDTASTAIPKIKLYTSKPLDGGCNVNEQQTNGKGSIPWILIIVIIVSVFLFYFILKKTGKLPFGLNVNGKLWQNPSGTIIYTLTIKNKTRHDVTVDKAMIELMKNKKEIRTFIMPVHDFPITLSKGTSHSVNVSLQPLFDQKPELRNYNVIRVSAECNAKRKYALPHPLIWRR